MANWLEKLLPPTPTRQGPKTGNRNLPANYGQNRLPTGRLPPNQQMPNASIVYGIAASLLFVLSIYFLFSRMWFNSLLVLLPAACFLGFSMYFMKHSE
jgi:hypothetical protein